MKQVIVIRTDLEMGKGKMCSQAAHASLSAAMECKEKAKTIFEVWYRDSQARIVFKVNSEEDYYINNHFKSLFDECRREETKLFNRFFSR